MQTWSLALQFVRFLACKLYPNQGTVGMDICMSVNLKNVLKG